MTNGEADRSETFQGPVVGPGGTLRSSSASQALALPSDGARHSPRGDSDPPALTFGPFGIAERLNCAKAKKRRMKTSSQRRISGSSYSSPLQAWRQRNAIFDGRKPWRSV